MPVEPLKEAPSQTAGPYVHIGTWPSAAGPPMRTQEKPNVLIGASAKVERILIEGAIVGDFKTGEWFFQTIKPGSSEGKAPFVTLLVFARGISEIF